MTGAHRDGLYLLLLGTVTFLLLGTALQRMPGTMGDFRIYYYSARCLIRGGDPYRAADALRVWHEEGGDRPSESAAGHAMISRFNNFPTTFSITAPIALLSFRAAILTWTVMSFLFLILAGFLMWNLAADYAPRLSGALLGFALANSELVVTNGNAAGICVGLCGIAVWCLLKSRFVVLGVLSLALSLAMKPQVAVLVWLFLWLSRGSLRKRAIQVLLTVVLLSLPIVFWLTHVNTGWVQEMHTNMVAFSARGDMNDPGPAAVEAHGATMIINLQAAVAYFDDDPTVYNSITYLACAALALGWILVARRAERSFASSLIGLAAAAVLTLLPVYHRECDAKILLLTVPACATIWSGGGRIGRVAGGITALGLFVTADIPWALDLSWVKRVHLEESGFSRHLLIASQMVPVPLILLAESAFFLWAFLGYGRFRQREETPHRQGQ